LAEWILKRFSIRGIESTMGNYKISIKVEVTECMDKASEARRQEDGSFEMTISETDAISIDKCEKAFLSTGYETIRQALSDHLTSVSKKRLKNKVSRES